MKYFARLMIQTIVVLVALFMIVFAFAGGVAALVLYILGWCGFISTAYGMWALITWLICVFISTATYLHSKNQEKAKRESVGLS